jgi:hypothetical protein
LYRGWIDVRVWKKKSLSGPGRFLGDPGVLPLEVNDEIRVEAEVNRPGYLYVIWIDTEGKPLPIYPWKGGRWDQLEQEQQTERLSLPETAGNRWPIGRSASGMETLVLLVRQTPWPRDQNLPDLLTGLPVPKVQDKQALVWFRDWAVVRDEPKRAPNLFDERRPADPVLRTQQLLQQRLGSHCAMSCAVSFANAGK